MKSFECGTLVPGCRWHVSSNDDADLVSRAVRHLREDHAEEVIRPAMVEAIKARIVEVPVDRKLRA